MFKLALSLAEVAPHVELYGGDPAVPHSFTEDRMIAAHGRQETWRGLSPMAGSEENRDDRAARNRAERP